MQINKSDLVSSALKLGISEKTAEELWNNLKQTSEGTHSKFELSSLLYYFGAMVVIIALGWFANITWANFEGKGLFSIAFVYMLAFFSIGHFLWHKKELKVPGGLFITLAVGMIPMAVYGVQKWTGLWFPHEGPWTYSGLFEWIKGESFTLQVATILAGCVALAFYRFPFLLVPILIASGFMSFDIAYLLFGDAGWSRMIDAWVCVGFGVLVLVAAYFMDLFMPEDFAFWGYLAGVFSFWWGVNQIFERFDLNLFIYLLINIFLVLLAIILQRTVFLVFGALGVLLFVTKLYGKYFAESNFFPAVLSLAGILIIFAGIAYQKNRQKIDAVIFGLLPKNILKWLPKPEKHKKI